MNDNDPTNDTDNPSCDNIILPISIMNNIMGTRQHDDETIPSIFKMNDKGHMHDVDSSKWRWDDP